MEDWVDLGNAATNMDTSGEPIKVEREVAFTAVLEPVSGIPLFESDATKATKANNDDEEHLMTLKANVKVKDYAWLQSVKEESVEILVILDRSGSMGGKPWQQVQNAMLNILNLTKDNPKINVKIMTYSNEAEFHKISSTNMTAANMALKSIRPTGMTNFVSVFNKISKYLLKGEGREDLVSKSGIVQGMKDLLKGKDNASKYEKKTEKPNASKVYVFFMTDGQDTCNKAETIMAAKERLQKDVATYGQEVIVSVLGFGDNHDDQFLESLSMLGTSDGTYNYIKPDTGDSALEQRLITLLEATTSLIGKSVYLEIKSVGAEGQRVQFLGEWFGEATEEMVLPAFLHLSADGDEAQLSTTKFVKIPKGSKIQLDIKMMRDLLDDSTEYPGKLGQIDLRSNEDSKESLQLRKLRAGLNMMTARLGESVDSGSTETVKKDLEPWLKAIKAHYEAIDMNKGSKQEGFESMASHVRSGLEILEASITRGDDEDDIKYGKRVRDTHTSYNLATAQCQNISSSKGGQLRAANAAPRTRKQKMKTALS